MGRRGTLIGGVTLALLLMTVSPALAQDSTEKVEMSWFQMFFWSSDVLGLIIIWFLLLLSAINMGLIIKFLLDSRRSVIMPEDTSFQVETMLQEKRYREAIDFAEADPSYLGKVVRAGLNEASNGYSSMERAIEEEADAEATRMLRPVEILNVAGNVSPMLGLFGTVYGMIRAFQALVAAGGKPNPATLAAGISTALVTTFWGLVVAMPALTAYALIRNKIDALTAEGLLRSEELIRPFKPAGKKAAPGAAKPAAGRPGAKPAGAKA